MSLPEPTVREHFEKSSPAVQEIYSRILNEAKKLGPVKQDPKKTSIHLVRRTAFAGIATRKEALWLTLKSDRELSSDRVARQEQASANRWHVEIRLKAPDEVDREVVTWIRKAYELAS